jgi:hypothetical protein
MMKIKTRISLLGSYWFIPCKTGDFLKKELVRSAAELTEINR